MCSQRQKAPGPIAGAQPSQECYLGDGPLAACADLWLGPLSPCHAGTVLRPCREVSGRMSPVSPLALPHHCLFPLFFRHIPPFLFSAVIIQWDRLATLGVCPLQAFCHLSLTGRSGPSSRPRSLALTSSVRKPCPGARKAEGTRASGESEASGAGVGMQPGAVAALPDRCRPAASLLPGPWQESLPLGPGAQRALCVCTGQMQGWTTGAGLNWQKPRYLYRHKNQPEVPMLPRWWGPRGTGPPRVTSTI